MTSPPSDRTRVRRLPERGTYDRETVLAILREGLVAHVGVVADGAPIVIPMVYGVDEEHVYLHGSAGSRLMKRLMEGADTCVEVTLLDALVIARSAFHHSMNYRSVVLHGRSEMLAGAAKLDALRTIVEHVVPGQWSSARQPSERELVQTAVVRVPLTEASAKRRGGPPGDDEEDHALPVWAGLIPIRREFDAPQDDPLLTAGIAPPGWITSYRRG